MPPIYSPAELFSVRGLVVVITGGGSGLGATVAHALNANGARAVYILGRRPAALSRTAHDAPGGNQAIRPVECDVTSKDSLAAAAARIEAEEGHVDVLWANAGMIGPGLDDLLADPGKPPRLADLAAKLWEAPMEDFTRVFAVNVTGVLYTAVAFLGLLDQGNQRRERGRPTSQIIVTTSIAAYTRRPAAGVAYSASKAAAGQMVKSLATMLAPYGIRANAIAPGFFPSEMTEGMAWMKGEGDPREEGNVGREVVPLGRTGREEDIAGLAMWLMSPAGSYVDGSVQLVDGGRVAILPATY